MEIQLSWQLTITDSEDRNCDDPVLQFVFLTMRSGTPIAMGQRTEQLASSTGPAAFRGRIGEPGGGAIPPPAYAGVQVIPLPPTNADPYFAFAVRGIDQDNSKGSDRDGDFGSLVNSVQNAANGVVGGQLSMDDLWTAANAPGLRDRRFKDDDDKIGVSGRVYSDYGRRIARAAAVVAEGTLLESEVMLESMSLRRDNATYDLNIAVRPYA
jgi:hypothetical protein